MKFGLEALRIDNTGNVGIGTSSPSRALEIKSSAPIIRLTEDTNTYSEVSANSSILSFKADEGNGAGSTRIDFRVDGTERMRIDSSGNLNFAQEAALNYPEQKLKWSNDSTTTNGFYLSQDTNRNGRVWHEQGLDILFGTASTERMRIDSSGRLGIGNAVMSSFTGNASDNLVVGSGSGSEGITVYSATQGSISFADGTSGDAAYRGAVEYSHTADHLAFRTAGTGNRMVIDSSGKVGIGTSSPDDTLHLVGATGYGLKNTDGTHTVVLRTVSGGGILKTASNHALVFGTNDTERARIDSSGRLLVGTSSTVDSSFTALLQVSTSGGALFALGNPNTVGAGAATLGQVGFYGYQGAYVLGASITANSDATWSTNDYPTRLVFSTTADSASSTTERMRIDSSGRMLIGTTTAPGFAQADDFTVSRSTDAGITIRSGTAHSATLAFSDGTGGGASEYRGLIQYSHLSNSLAFSTNSAERLRIDSLGRLLVGTSSASTTATTLLLQGSPDGASGPSYLRLATGTSSPGSASTIGQISFTDSGHTTAASIIAFRDGGTWASGSSQPTKLVFSTTADGASSPTERMRIDSSGSLLLGRTSAYNSSPGEVAVFQGNRHGVVIFQGANANYTGLNIRNAYANNGGNNVSGNMITFHDSGGTERGKIAMDGSSTSYITSSDYRLKENVVNITDGITRIKQLLPKRFNFIVDANTTVDGFLAHEAQAVVPEAITGTKDEVDDDGNAVMQGIDQSKLVPLLTAALQEAITKIETLEQRLTDAGL
jgi:hypothetical protein